MTAVLARMTTIATLPRISAPALRDILLEQGQAENPSIAIIDVRDEGISVHNFPSSASISSDLATSMPKIQNLVGSYGTRRI